MGVIYLDACILIYALEDSGARGDAVRAAMAGAREPLATSPLVLPECLVSPLRTGDHVMRDRYLAMYHHLETVELDDEAYLRAAELRVDHGLKTPDAIHLAAAQLAGASQLWTNDRRLAAASHGLAVDIVNG
ncbi:type II toxin-antitoxin system VapC family toxin [Microbacterium sp. KHB019]|uniref:type II toxin-antitoxin system VapC family toxin n=1 Tax=Microbacterium sp. KHB019 TaxID=3129770 RepID=UPI00307981C2